MARTLVCYCLVWFCLVQNGNEWAALRHAKSMLGRCTITISPSETTKSALSSCAFNHLRDPFDERPPDSLRRQPWSVRSVQFETTLQPSEGFQFVFAFKVSTVSVLYRAEVFAARQGIIINFSPTGLVASHNSHNPNSGRATS